MQSIDVLIEKDVVGELYYDKQQQEYGFNYALDISPISLTMPYKKSTYIRKYNLHPIFEMNLPEGYLFEIFKNYISKEQGYLDDFLIFSYLAPNIDGRLRFKSKFLKKTFTDIDLENILKNDTQDTFEKLLKLFLDKNAISGVQPKTLLLVADKESLSLNEYILKTWGEEYPCLAENEYYCMKAVSYAGIKIPKIQLSKNKKFLLVEKFNYDKKTKKYFGFEEVLVLQGKNRDKKYSGSYEQVANIIYSVTTNKKESMQQFYKTIVMNYLLKNGDAHLKNFGVLYDNDIKHIFFAPAYDIVNTTAYIFKDKPALTMFGKKIWYGKDKLIQFGIEHCYLSVSQTNALYDECYAALLQIMDELESKNFEGSQFFNIFKRMMDSFELSKDEKGYKEVPNEITKHW